MTPCRGSCAAITRTLKEFRTPMAEEAVEVELEKEPEIVIEVAPDDRPAKPQLSDEDVEKLAEPIGDDEVSKYAKDAQRRIKSLHQASQEWKRRVIRANNDLATA